MNQLTLNAIALSVFAMTLAILLGPLVHLSPTVTATTTLVMLGVLTVDGFKFQSLGLSLSLDAIAQRFPRYRQRIVHHEAGHFLVAHVLGLPISAYTLSVWDALRQGTPVGGVQIEIPESPNAQWWRQHIEAFCAVWVAGAIAEELQYGAPEGAEDDYRRLRQTLTQLNLSIPLYERQAQQRARQLLKDHWSDYEALVLAMNNQSTIADCKKCLKGSNALL
jgi:hypothetical protein